MPDWTDTLDARQAGTEPGFHSVHTSTDEHEDPIAEATGHQERLDVARAIAEEGLQPSRTNPVASVDPYVYDVDDEDDEEEPAPAPVTEPAPPPPAAEPAPAPAPTTTPTAPAPAAPPAPAL